MPKANVTPNQALNTLATQLKAEQAEQQLRLANYATPYGSDPEFVDFQRAQKYIEDHKVNLATTVFGQSSPNLQERVTSTVTEYMTRQTTLEALFTAGAEVTYTDEQLYQAACNRVFRNTRAGAQAQHAQVA